MIIEGSSDIVIESECRPLKNSEPSERLIIQNGKVIVLSSGAIGVYKHKAACDDPLGNGLISLVEIPQDHVLKPSGEQFVKSVAAGCVQLLDGKILLVLPAEVRLYASPDDALRGRNGLLAASLEEA